MTRFCDRIALEQAIKDLGDDFTLDAERAALFLDMQPSTLASRRSNRLPPPWKKNDDNLNKKGAPVSYFLGDLREFRKRGKVNLPDNTAANAEAKEKLAGNKRTPKLGKAGLYDLLDAAKTKAIADAMALVDSNGNPKEHGFWVFAKNPKVLIAYGLDNIDDSARRFKDTIYYRVSFYSWEDALLEDWHDEDLRDEYEKLVVAANGDGGTVLSQRLGAIRAARWTDITSRLPNGGID